MAALKIFCKIETDDLHNTSKDKLNLEPGWECIKKQDIDDIIDKEMNTSLSVKGALAHRLQHRTACKIQNGRQMAPKWQGGVERCLPLDFWAF